MRVANRFQYLNQAQRIDADGAFHFAGIFRRLHQLHDKVIYARLCELFTIRALEMSIGIDVRANRYQRKSYNHLQGKHMACETLTKHPPCEPLTNLVTCSLNLFCESFTRTWLRFTLNTKQSTLAKSLHRYRTPIFCTFNHLPHASQHCDISAL